MTTLDLTNNKWQYREYPTEARTVEDLEEKLWYDAVVPGSVYLSLAKTGHIDKKDLYCNPEKYEWVEEKPWIFRTKFEITSEQDGYEKKHIFFKKLDTYATIWVNGKLIGRTNNAFVCQRFDISDLLVEGENNLMIKFDPAVETAQSTMEKYTKFDGIAFRHPYRVYARKPQYSFGWDFCPHLPGCGIADELGVEFSNTARISDVHIRTLDCNQHYADVKVAVELEKFLPADAQCEIKVSGTGLSLRQSLDFTGSSKENSVVFHIERPFLWWPKGYGIQYLYELEINLKNGDEIIDSYFHKFGIRTVKVQQNKDREGTSFQFIVNDMPINIKGANWVAVSQLSEQGKDDYKRLLGLAQSANFNMLRVWGGGDYERDIFYKTCDELGILVWQDFMFACGQYPQQKWFMDMVENETVSVVKRLRNYSSIAIWCGNNECQQGHRGKLFGNSKRFSGKKIFDNVIPGVLAELDKDRDYIPTTPYPAGVEGDSPDTGTMHNWAVWGMSHDPFSYISDPAPRFAGEFGLQGLSSVETLEKFLPKEKLRPGSYQLEKTNYNNFLFDGNTKIYKYAFYTFPPTDNLEHLVYFSQLSQARAIKLYIEFNRLSPERNSGTLYWQFNEPFPATTWSSVDYFKNPKALYYYARRFYKPVLIALDQHYHSAEVDSAAELVGGSIYVVNDLGTPLTGEVLCELKSFDGEVKDKLSTPLRVAPRSISLPVKLPEEFITNQTRFDCFLHLRVIIDGRTLAENIYLLTKDKYVNLPEGDFNAYITETDRGRMLNIESDIFIKDLCVSPVSRVCKDNFIDIIPGQSKQIELPENIKSETLSYLSVNQTLQR